MEQEKKFCFKLGEGIFNILLESIQSKIDTGDSSVSESIEQLLDLFPGIERETIIDWLSEKIELKMNEETQEIIIKPTENKNITHWERTINERSKRINSMALEIKKLENILLAGNNTLYFDFDDISENKSLVHPVYYLINLLNGYEITDYVIELLEELANKSYDGTYVETLIGQLYPYICYINKLVDEYLSYSCLINDLVTQGLYIMKKPDTEEAQDLLYRFIRCFGIKVGNKLYRPEQTKSERLNEVFEKELKNDK